MGQLFYVIGASGVGKDSVMEYAKKKINGDCPVLFAHRYITRPVVVGEENHISLSDEEFKSMHRGNLFVFHWKSHKHYYGIGIEINQWLDHDYNVVVNGSREYLSEAQNIKQDLQVILIIAKPEIIKERLIKRGRESRQEIEERLVRNKNFNFNSSNIIRIPNDGILDEAGNKFIEIITKASPPRPVDTPDRTNTMIL